MMGDLEKLLNKKGFKIKNYEPIKGRVYELEDSLMAKLSWEDSEIKPAFKLEGIDNENWAKVVKVIPYGDEYIIITEKLDELTDEYKKKHEEFFSVNRWVGLIILFVRIITFGFLVIRYSKFKRYYKDGAKEWYDFMVNVITQTKECGVGSPSDFMASHNLGMKGDKMACFDIMDEKNIHFEDIFC